ncbi:MAG TPA: GNAT family N-acetyltransferase [Candidatus Nanopelagicales bacterium]|nr:GNAT family N-acetyltransferase [Candidatus Nanopelagicales bacterium]
MGSVSAISDAELDRVTGRASVFFDRRWLRLLDALDLAPLVGGALTLRYVLVYEGEALAAVCPFVLADAGSIHYVYSFEKSFFTSWQDDLARINPEMAGAARWLSLLITGFRRLVTAAGVPTRRWILSASPLSFRGAVAVAPLEEAARRRVLGAALARLEEVGRAEDAPIWFFRIPGEEAELREALAERGFDEVLALYDNVIEGVEGGLDGYLARFRRGPRGNIKREMSRIRKAGVSFEVTRDPSGLEHELSALYEATYSKYGPERFGHPPSFWGALSRALGPHAEFILARRGGTLVGFTLLLHKGDLWAYRLGKQEDAGDDGAFLYFSLAFYEPIRRAGELGARRLWLGPGGWGTKHHRGAMGYPLYSAFWFPSRVWRAALLPYLQAFSWATHRQLEFSTQRSTNTRGEAP